MAIAVLLTRSLTQYRAGRRSLPFGTGPAAPLAALPTLARACGPRGFAPAIGCTDAALFAARMVNDVPHRPAAAALAGARLADVAAHIHYENRP